MALKRIMLLGARGQVGQAIQAQPLPADWQMHAYGHADLDITQHHSLQSVMRDIKPDLIINSAAMTAVDDAEQDAPRAIAINFDAVANIAAQASAMDIPVIHLSTDYVFDGRDGETPYQTEDRMNPLNVYGETKMMGEEALRHTLAWHIILRISSVFSPYGKNLLTTMLAMIDTRDEIKAVTDMKGTPTSAIEVAKGIMAIGSAVLKGKHDGFGVFHLAGIPEATRFEFTQAIMDAYAPYTGKRPKITAATTDEFPGRAVRPSYSALDSSKIRQIYGIEPKPWREGLAEAMAILMKNERKSA